MTARWLLVFSVAAHLAERLPPVLAAIPRVAVASLPEQDHTVITVEVDADLELVDTVTRQVREVDPDATRLHDSIIDLPEPGGGHTDVSMDFDVSDEPSPCRHCAEWRHEIATSADGRRVLREWHRSECPEYQSWL